MKKVIKDKELYQKMAEAVNLLSDTVKTTLGPKGSNVIINSNERSVFITNDGVTIALSIDSDDLVIQSILEIAKEASIKTDENVGDGTTTTLVLLQEIFKQGVDLIFNGQKPLEVAKKLVAKAEEIVNKIESYKQKTNDKILEKLASNSANDTEIGKVISKVYSKIGFKEGITLKEGNTYKTSVEYLPGYVFSSTLASPYYFNKSKALTFSNAIGILVSGVVDSLDVFGHIINQIVSEDRALIILADDFSEDALNSALSLFLQNDVQIILIKNPEYGTRQNDILQDLAILWDCEVINNVEHLTSKHFGKIKEIVINQKSIITKYTHTDKLKAYVARLSKISDAYNDFENEYLQKRMAMLKNGLAVINIGGVTTSEIREKKMRYEDALSALVSANNGVLPGAGIVLFRISGSMSNGGIDKVFKEALPCVFRQIIENAAIDYAVVEREIINCNFEVLYNVNKEQFEEINKTDVIDSYNVVVNSFLNAVSIAAMLLSTSSLVINEIPLEKNISDYD